MSRYPPRNPLVNPYDRPPTLPDNEPDGPPDPFFKLLSIVGHINEHEHEPHTDTNDPEGFPHHQPHVPQDATLQPMLYTWARALTRMPSLEEARLMFDIDFCLNAYETQHLEREVIYKAPTNNKGGRFLLDPEERNCRRLIFHNTRYWRPEEKTMDLLLSVGSKAWPGTRMLVLTPSDHGNTERKTRWQE